MYAVKDFLVPPPGAGGTEKFGPDASPTVSAPELLGPEGAGPIGFEDFPDTGNNEGLADDLRYLQSGMIANFPNDELVAVWQASNGSVEGASDQGIYLARSDDHGRLGDKGKWWSPPVRIVDPAGAPVWGPVLHVDAETVFLIYSESKPECHKFFEGFEAYGPGGTLKMIKSTTNGHTWSDAQTILEYANRGPVGKLTSNKIDIGPSGEWMLPIHYEKTWGNPLCSEDPSHVDKKPAVLISEDKGNSWYLDDVFVDRRDPTLELTEPTIAHLTLPGIDESRGQRHKKEYIMYMKTNTGAIYSSSLGKGGYWALPMPLDLPNFAQKVTSCPMPDGRILLVFNDRSSHDEHKTALTLATTNNGTDYDRQIVIHPNDHNVQLTNPVVEYLPEEELYVIIFTVMYPKKGTAVGMDCYGLQVAMVPAAALDDFSDQQTVIIDVKSVNDGKNTVTHILFDDTWQLETAEESKLHSAHPTKRS